MRKTLCLVFLGCALVVGLACSGGDSSTPTAPEQLSGLQSTTAEAGDKIYLCHGDKSQPYGVVVEVGDIRDKRHFKHLQSGRDCVCEYSSIPGEQCLPFQDPYNSPTCDSSCPSNV
jgi:hypothetical protein